MKKEIIESELTIKNNEYRVEVKGKEGYTTPETLISYLKKGVYNKKIKACTPKSEKGYTTFKFKVYDEEGLFSNYFVVKVKNKERYLHIPVINAIKEITGVSCLIKKVNVNRFIAGVAASALILTVAGPSLVKGLDEILKKDYEYDMQRYNKYSYSQSIKENLTEEEKEAAMTEYYKDLEQRAKAGDKAALEEYENYLFEQKLIEQMKSENQGYHR